MGIEDSDNFNPEAFPRMLMIDSVRSHFLLRNLGKDTQRQLISGSLDSGRNYYWSAHLLICSQKSWQCQSNSQISSVAEHWSIFSNLSSETHGSQISFCRSRIWLLIEWATLSQRSCKFTSRELSIFASRWHLISSLTWVTAHSFCSDAVCHWHVWHQRNQRMLGFGWNNPHSTLTWWIQICQERWAETRCQKRSYCGNGCQRHQSPPASCAGENYRMSQRGM
jgi:hypothetical protein